MMTQVSLSVNLNKIALLRNSRGGVNPEPCEFARTALDAGAHGITVHPRPDQRHVLYRDVMSLAELCRKRTVEFNMEGNPFSEASGSYPGFMDLAEKARPHQCTLVPDASEQITSDHGFEPNKHSADGLRPIVRQLNDWGCRVSIFADPIEEVVDFATSIGVARIELYTGPYVDAIDKGSTPAKEMLRQYVRVANLAQRSGLAINAGHDLNLLNLRPFVEAMPHLQEVSIGHALITDALRMGLELAVRAYLKCLS
jgi:pyridoxine 5-phosphate synthase